MNRRQILLKLILCFVVILHNYNVEATSAEKLPGEDVGGVQKTSEANSPESKLSSRVKVSATKGHVLFFHNAGTTSHINAMKALAEGLVENGHKVTTVFYVKTNIVHENYKEIFIEDR